MHVHWHLFMAHGSIDRRRAFINVLDDDSLLCIFYHCRPPILLEEGTGPWFWKCESERWWYGLTWVCRRWRHIVLASPSYLGISLVCRQGTPVADVLAHSPPLPLVIDYLLRVRVVTAEDEEGILLAFKHRHRLRHIQCEAWSPLWEGLVAAANDDAGLPMLEYLCISSQFAPISIRSLPSTLYAPRLRHLTLHYFFFPIGCSSLAGLVTLALHLIYPPLDSDFGPNELLQQLSLMPRLETLRIHLTESFSVVEGQSLHIPLSTPVTLPSLLSFAFKSPLPYTKLVLPRIAMPLLKDVEITPFGFAPPVYFVLQCMCKTENPKFRGVKVLFWHWTAEMTMHSHEGSGVPTVRIGDSHGRRFDGLESTVQRLREMGPAFSDVEFLTLEDETPAQYRDNSIIPRRTDWHELLGLFSRVRSLHVAGGDLIEGLSHSLIPEDQESLTEVLPNLRELSYPKGSHIGKSCRSFIAVRRNAGCPVTLACR